MSPADPEIDWDTALRPLRRAAAVLSVLQMVALLALFVVVLFASASFKAAGYALAGGILVMELGQWGLSRAALRRCPGFDPGERYASRPLNPGQQRVVEFNLLTTLLSPVVLALIIPTTSFKHEKLVVFVLLLAAMAPGFRLLWRVRRNHSWLAASRIPASPRRRPSIEPRPY